MRNLFLAGGERGRNAQYVAVEPALANQQAQAAGGFKHLHHGLRRGLFAFAVSYQPPNPQNPNVRTMNKLEKVYAKKYNSVANVK